MEKKFADRHVVFVAQRRTMPKPARNTPRNQRYRPYSRTITSVHEKILEDLVYPTEIVGKRTKYGVDGSRLIKWCVALEGSPVQLMLTLLQLPGLERRDLSGIQARLLLVGLQAAHRQGRRLRISRTGSRIGLSRPTLSAAIYSLPYLSSGTPHLVFVRPSHSIADLSTHDRFESRILKRCRNSM